MTKARTEGQKRRQKREPAVPKPAVAIIPEVREIGPTEEAKRHGDYRAPDSKGALAVYTNAHVNRLGKLAGHGAITRRQQAAGLAFEATWVRVWGSASPSRDSTIPPIGGRSHETDTEAERMAKARARLNTILNRVGPPKYGLLVSVCVFGERLGLANTMPGKELRQRLREALDECALCYGLAEAA